VLVVGAGPSGQQIAEELARTGRRVVIAAGRHRTLPRRYRGLDTYRWMDRLGAFDRTVDDLADPSVVRRAPAFVVAGGREDLDLRRLVAAGVVPAGRLTGIQGPAVRFAGDLAATVAAADDNVRRFRASVDGLIARARLTVDDPEELPRPPGRWAVSAPAGLHLDREAVRTVLWATGYRRDFSWLHAPVLDTAGEPVQHRGVTPALGLYFLGLRWMHRRSSDAIHGVGGDAAFLAEQIACRRSAHLIAA
jgi:putative flavoprotein involved in K+ transport